MQGLTFTPDNLDKVLSGTKTMTRRMHKKPRYKVGDIVPINETLIELDGFVAYKRDKSLVTRITSHRVAVSVFWEWKVKTLSQMYMPNKYARYHAEITSVKQEPIQDISVADIIAEGCPAISSDVDGSELYEWWIELWDSIYAKKDGCSWADNPSPCAYGYKLTNCK